MWFAQGITGRDRSRLLAIWLLAATPFNLWVVNHYYPMRDWLFFVYCKSWLLSLAFCLACLSVGWQLLSWILPSSPRLQERLVLAFAIGVLCFFAGMFLGGLAGLYCAAFFWVWPALLILAGAPRLFGDLRRYAIALRPFGVRLVAPRGPLEVLPLMLLVLGVVAVYLPALIPENIGYDACWYHLPIAEDYVAHGGLRRFDEGWYLGAYPHLASLLYAWAFLAPLDLYQHVVLCSHLEFCVFLATLLGISVLAERLVRGRLRSRMPYAAAAMFLFPAILSYDASLITTADHILAFWAAPIAITMVRLGKRFTSREACLSGALMAGAVCTKLQSVYLFVPSCIIVGALTVRYRRWQPALTWGFVCAAVSSTYWLRNWIYYHDPLYPLLNAYLASNPLHAGADQLIRRIYWAPGCGPEGHSPLERTKNALIASLTFSILPGGQRLAAFPGSHFSTFGWLYTSLTLPAVFLLRASRRLWVLVLALESSLFVWYLTSRQDRFLQAIMPLCAAATAAALLLVWRAGLAARFTATILICAQVVWASDTYFLGTHAMAGDTPIRVVSAHLGAAYQKHYKERFQYDSTYVKIHDLLPRHTRLLLHQSHLRLGLGVECVTDGPGWQGEFEYLDLSSPGRALATWKKLGITHVLWQPEHGGMDPDTLVRELVFMRAVREFTFEITNIDGWSLRSLVSDANDPNLAAADTRLAWLACDAGMNDGIYTTRGASNRTPETKLDSQALAQAPLSALAGVNAIALNEKCDRYPGIDAQIGSQFAQLGKADTFRLWVRQRR